jgi:hypothetical protein
LSRRPNKKLRWVISIETWRKIARKVSEYHHQTLL